MDADLKAAKADKRLNDLVAVTVVVLSVFMAVSKIKDDNIIQAMQKAKSESVDATTGIWPPGKLPNMKVTSINTSNARPRRWRKPRRSKPNMTC